MARIKKSKGSVVGKELLQYIKENRTDLTTQVTHGSVDVSIDDGVLVGGHFKLRSAMKQAGLNSAEIDNALALAQQGNQRVVLIQATLLFDNNKIKNRK